MHTIPSDLYRAFEVIGATGNVNAKRLSDIAAPVGFEIAHVCPCSFFQVFLTPVALRDRSVMVGRCVRCGVVYWAEWVSKEERPRHFGQKRSMRM